MERTAEELAAEEREQSALRTTGNSIVLGRRFPGAESAPTSADERNENYAKMSDRDLLAEAGLWDKYSADCDGYLAEAMDKAEIKRERHIRDVADMADKLPDDSATKGDWKSLIGMSDDDLRKTYNERLEASESPYINALIKSPDKPPFELENDAQGETREADDAVMRARTVADARGLTDDWRTVEERHFAEDARDNVRDVEQEIDRRPNADELKDRLAEMRDARDQRQEANESFNEDHERGAGPSRDRELTPPGPHIGQQPDEREQGRSDAEFLGREAAHILPQGELDRQRDAAKLSRNPDEDRGQGQKLEPEMTRGGSSQDVKSAPRTALERQIEKADQSFAQHQATQQKEDESVHKRR